MAFILAQICGVVTFILTVICVQLKSKDKILLFQIMSNTVDALQYFLLNGITGGILSVINIIRCIVFYNYKKKNKKPSLAALIIFIILAVLLGILTWQNVFSIIPIIASIIFTYGFWQDNVKHIKICIAIGSGCWIIYNIIVKAYTGAIQLMIVLISTIIAIFKFKENPQFEDSTLNI